MTTATLNFNIPAGGSAQVYSTTLLGDTGIVLTLSGPPNADGFYTVTGASGMIDIGGINYSISGVSLGTDGADNLFNPNGVFLNPTDSTGFVDANGITFITSDANADGIDSSGVITSTDINFSLLPNGGYFIDADNSSQVATTVTASVCFRSGTLIRTARGEIPVEDLAADDLAVTASGETRPIKWIGHRKVDRPSAEQMPVRVMAGAFGKGLPARDLFLSPGHAVCVSVVDEVFAPVGKLINGATIAQVEVSDVTYWHVELESHDVLLAEGLPCESYMDAGNRAWFGRNHGRLAEIDPHRAAESLTRYARLFVDGGPVVEAIRDRLAARAETLGWTRAADMDPHLLVDGSRVEPRIDGDLARFIFPAKARDVRLVSQAFVAAELGLNEDRRRLGIRVKGMALSDGLRVRREIALDDVHGFHPGETASGVAWRWTDGDLALPVELWTDCMGQVIFRLAFDRNAGWRWIAPEREPLRAVA